MTSDLATSRSIRFLLAPDGRVRQVRAVAYT
jgi:hypothetical protein